MASSSTSHGETMAQSLLDRTGILPFPTRLTPESAAPTRDSLSIDSGTLAVDWRESAIEYRGARVSLLRVELQLLGALLEANGGVVSRASLIQAAWPRADTQSRENSLAVYVCGLRKRLAAIGLPGALETVRREGYRFRP